MNCVAEYQSPIFTAIPNKSGYLLITVADKSVIVSVATSTGVLAYLKEFEADSNEDSISFYKKVFAENQELFARNYAQASLQVNSAYFSLLPFSLFNAQNKSQYLEALIPSINKYSIETKELEWPSCQMVYAIDKELLQLCDQSLGNYSTAHVLQGFLAEVNKTKGISVYLEKQHFSFVQCTNGELKKVNRMAYTNGQDIAYYLLLLLQQEAIEPNNAIVALCGEKALTNTIKEQLTDFIANVEIANPTARFTIKDNFKGDLNKYIILFNHLYASS